MAGRPEGVGPTGLGLLRQIEVGAARAATPSVAFGDISPRGAGLSHMSDGLDEIVVIPRAFFDAVADGDFVDVGGLKNISGDAV